jgi:hypothetical protein
VRRFDCPFRKVAATDPTAKEHKHKAKTGHNPISAGAALKPDVRWARPSPFH